MTTRTMTMLVLLLVSGLAGCEGAPLTCATPVPPPDGGYSDAAKEGGTGGGPCVNPTDCR